MQNPLRRPKGQEATRDRDVERNKRTPNSDEGVLSKGMRGHFVAMSGEFVGTVMFLYFAFAATQIANTIQGEQVPNLNQLMFISLSFGFSLLVTAWVFYRISGGLFNPAVRKVVLHSNQCELTGDTGDSRHGHHRHTSTYPRPTPISCTNIGWHGRCWLSFLHVPGNTCRGNHLDARNFESTRCFH